MRVGICSWAFGGTLRGARTIHDLCEAAKAAGFDFIEAAYSVRDPLHVTRQDLETAAVPVKSVATLELHRHYLTDASPKRREQAVHVVTAMIDRAAECGIRSVSFSPGRLAGDQPIESVLDEVAAVLDGIVGGEVHVCLENLPGHILERRDAMRGLLDRIPRAGVCLDIGNALLDPPLQAWFSDFGSRIKKIHLSDFRLNNGQLSPVLPGDGDVDWAAAIDCLRSLDSSVDVFLEAAAPLHSDERRFLDSCRAAVDRVFGKAVAA